MKICIVGPASQECQELFDKARVAIAEAGVWADLQKVEDPAVIMGYGVTLTPALMINDYVRVSGRVPSQEEVTEIISRANQEK